MRLQVKISELLLLSEKTRHVIRQLAEKIPGRNIERFHVNNSGLTSNPESKQSLKGTLEFLYTRSDICGN